MGTPRSESSVMACVEICTPPSKLRLSRFAKGTSWVLAAAIVGDGHGRPADADPCPAALGHQVQALVARRPEPPRGGQCRRTVAALLMHFIGQTYRQQGAARTAGIVQQRQRAGAPGGLFGRLQRCQCLGTQYIVEGDDDAAFFRRIIDGDFRDLIAGLDQQYGLQCRLDAIGRPGLDGRDPVGISIIFASRAARTTFAVFHGHGGEAVNFDQIHSCGQLQCIARESHAPDGTTGIWSQRTVGKGLLAGFVDTAVNAVALLGILTGHVNAFDLHEVEQARAIGVFGDVSRRPQAFVHDSNPS